MKNILSIFGTLCVCFGIIVNSAQINSSSFAEMLQNADVLDPPGSQLQKEPETQTERPLERPLERQPQPEQVTPAEKTAAYVEKKCTTQGMFCVHKNLCIDGYISRKPTTNSGRTHNQTQMVECSLNKVCCSIPLEREVCTGTDNYCVPKEACVNGEIDTGGRAFINPMANTDGEEICTATEACCKLVRKEQTGDECTGTAKYCVSKETCINGNIETSTGPYSSAKTKCDQSQVCCQYGGQDVKGQAKYGEFPWVVQILEKIYNPLSYEYSYLFVGSLVAPNIVLTVAHNVVTLNETDLLVRAGEWDTRIKTEPEPYSDRNVKTVIIHERFHQRSLNFDIAILVLTDSFRLGPFINTISLPSADMKFDHSRCIVAGWGKKQKTDEDYSPILKKIAVSVVPRETCQQQLREAWKFRFFELQSSFICTNGDDEKPCDGDGGAPLMCPVVDSPNRYELAGVLSFSSKPNTQNAPDVYVNVPMVRSWISEKTSYE